MKNINNNDAIIYNPNIPLNKQVVKANEVGDLVNLLGIPYNYRDVIFKPLDINGKLFNLTLQKRSTVGSDKENGVYIYDKLTFKIEDDSGKIQDDIETKDIEQLVKGLYSNEVKLNASEEFKPALNK